MVTTKLPKRSFVKKGKSRLGRARKLSQTKKFDHGGGLITTRKGY